MAPKKASRVVYNPRTRDGVVEVLNDVIKSIQSNPDKVTIEDLVNMHNVALRTWHSWRQETYKEDTEIQILFERIDCLTRCRLVENALDGSKNPWFTAFLLRSKHGFDDKQKIEVDANVKQVSQINVTIDGSGESIDV